MDRLNFIQNLSAGDMVYWTDPDNNFSSGYYNVTDVQHPIGEREEDTIVYLVNEAGSTVEVFMHELT